MTLYRSKPSEIEAVQWTGNNVDKVRGFLGGPNGIDVESTDAGWSLQIVAGKGGAQGFVPVPVGHWIVRQPGDLTDHWPVDPGYFTKKYEPVEG